MKHFYSILIDLKSLLHSKWQYLFQQKFPLLSHDLNTVSLNDKDQKSSRRISSFENNFRKFRSGHMELFFKTGVFKKIAILTGKHLRWSLFLIKLQAWRSATLLKKRLHKKKRDFTVVSCENYEIFNNTFCMEHLRWLLLKIAEEFLRNSNLSRGICTEEFIRNFSLCFNDLRKGFVQKNLKEILVYVWTLERFVKTFSDWRYEITYTEGIASTVFYPTARMIICDV